MRDRKNRKKRERQLRRQAERVARTRPGDPTPTGDARFVCGTCGTEFRAPAPLAAGIVMFDADGKRMPFPPGEHWSVQAPCPVCNTPAPAQGQINTVGASGAAMMGIAETQAELAALLARLEELDQLAKSATFDEMTSFLKDSEVSALSSVGDWLTENRDWLEPLGALAGIAGLIAAVIFGVLGLMPDDDDHSKRAPGISEEDRRRIVRDLAEVLREASENGDHRQGKGDQRKGDRPPGDDSDAERQ